MRLERCSLAEAMLTDLALKRTEFTDTDLTAASLQGTMLKGIDLTGCTLTGNSYGEALRELRGAIVSPVQAVELAKLLGVVVRD